MVRLGTEVVEKPTRRSLGVADARRPPVLGPVATTGKESAHISEYKRKQKLCGKRVTTYKLENDKEDVVHNKRPLPPVAVSRDTEGDCSNGPEHQHERDAPRDFCRRAIELLGERRDCEGHGEEIERVPRLDRVSDE